MEQANQIIGLLAVAAMLVAGAAIMVARAPARRLGPRMVLLLFAPVIPMAIVLGLGALFSPAHDAPLSNVAFLVMLVGIFAVIPWMVACAIGYAIGCAIRRRHPPQEASAAVPSAMSVPVRPQPAARIAPDTSAEPRFSHHSPDGSIRIDILPVEWAASQWVNTPRVVDMAGERTLCNLMGTDWEANTAFPRERYVWLGLRRYRSPGYLFAECDLDADRYRIALASLDTPDEEGPLGDMTGRLEYWWDRATELAMARAPQGEAPSVAAPHPFAAWRTALVLLVAAIIAIAGLTWLSMETGIDPPDVRTIPHIPRIPH